MQHLLKLLIFCTLKSVNSNSIENPVKMNEVNILISKIMQAEKFNELVDLIAERAVAKLKDAQTYETSSNDSMSIPENYSKENLKEEPISFNTHTHGKIDARAVLEKKAYPLNNLKLRYRNLKSKHVTESNSKDNLSSVSLENKDFSKTAQNVQSDFDTKGMMNEQSLENSFENTENRVPLKNPSEKETEANWEQSNSHDDEMHVGSQSAKENISGQFNFRAKSSSENTYTTNNRGGAKEIAFVESPDYKEYHEQVAKVKDSLALKL